MASLKDINWHSREDSTEIRRPFTFKLEETIARNFINTVKKNGLFVRETMVKLMREYIKEFGEEEKSDVKQDERKRD